MFETRLQLNVTPDIQLRLQDESDARQLFQLIQKNRTYLRQWLGWLDYTQKIEDMLTYVRSTHLQYQKKQSAIFAIWLRNQIVGSIGYAPIDWVNRKAEIGYWLAEDFQGQGIMTCSCQTLITYAFEQMKLNKVEIRCATGNSSSRAIPQRLNFTLEGTARQAEWLYDHYVDLHLFGLLRSEWRPIVVSATC